MNDDYWVLVENYIYYPKYYFGDIYGSSVHYATHFRSEEDAVASIPNDGVAWMPMHVTWLKSASKRG